MKECVLIVYGGKSVEHEISIITALQVAKNVPQNFDFRLCYITRKGEWFLAENLSEIGVYQNFKKHAKKPRKVAMFCGENVLWEVKKHKISPLFRVRCVLNCCHGHIGEDGALQGLLQCVDVPQTSPGTLQSPLCMDKIFFKELCKAKKILTPDFLVFHQGEDREKFATFAGKKLKFPLVVKPSNLGSSIGISYCKNEQELQNALDLALTFSSKIVVERAVQNLREFNCACFSYRGKIILSSVAEVTNKAEIFTFEDKYLSKKNNSQRTLMNLEGEEQENCTETDDESALLAEIGQLTKKIYEEFELSGIVRVDFLFDSEQKKLFVNEVNTIPGSLAFYLFKDVAFSELIGAAVEEAIRRHEAENSKITTFDSDVLKIFEDVSNSMKK